MAKKNTSNQGVNSKTGGEKNNPSQTKLTSSGFGKITEFIFYFALLLLAVLTISIRSKFFEIPFERDEGTYCYYAQLVLDGKPLYTSFDAMKFPGIYYAYALVISLFGNSLVGVHTGFMWMNILTMISLALAVKLLLDNISGVVTGASYVVISMNPLISGFTAQSEHIIAFCVAVSLLFMVLYYQKKKPYFVLISGLFIGFALMIKQSAVFYVPVIGLPILLEAVRGKFSNWKNFIVESCLYTIGVFLPFVVGCVIVWKQGVWSDFIFWTIEYPKTYVSQVSFERGMEHLGRVYERMLKYYSTFWYMALIGIALMFFIREKMDWWKKAVFFLLPFAGFMTVVPGYRFYGHYWLQLLPVWALFIGIGFYAVKDLLSYKLPVVASSLVILLSFSVYYYSHIDKMKTYYFKPNYKKVMRETYGSNPFTSAKVISEFIKKRAVEGDQLAVLGSEPQVNFYTNLRAPSRHAYMAHLVGLHPNHVEWQQEFISDVEKARPRFIVFFDNSISWIYQKGADKSIFQWMNKYVPANYKSIGIADVVSPLATKYLWDKDVIGYKPVSKSKIFVYERKDSVQPILNLGGK